MYEKTDPQQKGLKLWKMSCLENEICLTTYAGTIAYDQMEGKNPLMTNRFGGYPEQVYGMADVIYGVGTIPVELEDKAPVIQSVAKQYRRFLSHDGIYAEATLLVEDNSLRTEKELQNNNTKEDKSNDFKRTTFLFMTMTIEFLKK